MSSQQIRRQLDAIFDFLQPYSIFTNCHMVNFLTDKHWENFVPKEIQSSIKTENDIQQAIEEVFWNPKQNTKFHVLSEFISQLKRFHLENSIDLTISRVELKEILKLNGNDKNLTIKEFMSAKKRHEVEITAAIIADLLESAENSSEFYIIDAGDGKGYLSSRLALQYKFKVLGVDAKETNTEGAQERNRKLQRVWNGLTERAELIDKGEVPPRRSKKQFQRKKLAEKLQPEFSNDFVITSPNYKTKNQFITPNLNFVSILQQEFKIDSNPKICLTGLHTCGNLASTCLKIFSAQQSMKLLCNIGCCYHLLNEEFYEDGFTNKEIAEKNQEFGFPMSQYLREKQIKLGRNARMLASQSIHRTVARKDISSQSLFYRALLEVLISQHKPELENKVQVGKIKKYENFKGYLQKCNEKLNLNLNLQFNVIEKKFQFEEKLLDLFYLIRMHFAPVLENVILLDRLLYLKENGLENSYLLELFEPILSPRCYAIISIKP